MRLSFVASASCKTPSFLRVKKSGALHLVALACIVRWFNKREIWNPGWDGENCGTVSGWDDNEWHADLDDKLLPTVLLGTP